MRGIGKTFPGVHALDDVDVDVHAGEILGLVGENGAGKSTLVKILAGAYTRDDGDRRRGWRGRRRRRSARDDAARRGRDLPGAGARRPPDDGGEHLHGPAADEPSRTRSTGSASSPTPSACRNASGSPSSRGYLSGRLSVARRQMVEIAKALSRDARLIVLDEPSAVLGDAELQGLFDVIRRLAAKGTAFIYISHRLGEVFKITDRVTVMKDGRVVATERTADLTSERLVRLMVGRDVLAEVDRTPTAPGAVALDVRGLTRAGVIADVSLHVRSGEILAIAGLAGAGRTEVLRAIFGADPIDGGEITVFGEPVRIRRPRDAVALGIGLLTEDRKADGLLMLAVTRLQRDDHPAGRRLQPAGVEPHQGAAGGAAPHRAAGHPHARPGGNGSQPQRR